MPTVKAVETAANCIAELFGEEERERFISKMLKRIHTENA